MTEKFQHLLKKNNFNIIDARNFIAVKAKY